MVNFESPSSDNNSNDYEDEMDIVVIEVLVVGAAFVVVIVLIWAAINCSRKTAQVDIDPPSGVTDYKIEHGLITEVFDGTNHRCAGNGNDSSPPQDQDGGVSGASEKTNEKQTIPEALPVIVCALCSKPIQIGDVICKSYNPECQHIHHKECMTNHWLHLQNTCPTCNRTFLIEQA